jgi:hypothetical protein
VVAGLLIFPAFCYVTDLPTGSCAFDAVVIGFALVIVKGITG